MDPALLRERELFKKKALSTPVVEKKKKDDSSAKVDNENKRKQKLLSNNSSNINGSISYKSMSGSSQYKFGVLAKIVKYMRQRHQDGDDHPLTLDEILDETNQLDVGSKVKLWLETEVLLKNPKIDVKEDGKFLFKPPYKIKDKKGLLRLLRQHDMKGLGGIMLEDIQESLPHSEKALKNLQNELVYINRPLDKKKIVFYNDKSTQLEVDDDFQKLWRSIAVEGMDDQKIEEYLEKQGIRSMQDNGIVRKTFKSTKRKINQKKKTFKRPRDNEHLADVLENYDNDK